MLTTFVVLQVCINAALLVLLARLLRERAASARQAHDREGRLEALASELCAVGREMARQELPCMRLASPPPNAAGSPTDAGNANPASVSGDRVDPPRELGERARGAMALLERGMGVEAVATETSLLLGEVQLLRNLHRAPTCTNGVAQPQASRRRAGVRAHRDARQVRA